MSNKPSNNRFHSQIVNLLQSAKSKIVRSVNQTMVITYFQIGKMIVEEEQDGKKRAGYGKEILKELSFVLKKEFGKGFSVTNLKQMKTFYLLYQKGQTVSDQSKKKKSQTVSAESISETLSRKSKNKDFTLSWSHYLKLMRIDDENERKFYEIEAAKNNWSVRELQRQFDSALYIRLTLSRNKNQSVVEYTLPENNAQIFASKYETILPSKEELKSLITEQDTQH